MTQNRSTNDHAEADNEQNKLNQNGNNNMNKLKLKEEEDSVERVFQHQLVPSWRNQLTVRAFVVSFFLSVLFSFIVMKLNLTTGIIPSLNVSAGLLGFFFIKTWTKFLEYGHFLLQYFLLLLLSHQFA
ncbi:hypothetical protein Lal_00009882 [Lupinus albus]|uniref:Putative oligopeptide transporter, OPT superfamily n=1 Tax=Lupinus albus TaxID=3870 RepID=A0A6A4NHP6_LUPAL|nr:putative oligopeptide transporter, OPT superfamily [Lupinus albus]KAF1859298.1 hypothetical protein Lal_00009882 [Lupinus albus]